MWEKILDTIRKFPNRDFICFDEICTLSGTGSYNYPNNVVDLLRWTGMLEELSVGYYKIKPWFQVLRRCDAFYFHSFYENWNYCATTYSDRFDIDENGEVALYERFRCPSFMNVISIFDAVQKKEIIEFLRNERAKFLGKFDVLKKEDIVRIVEML